MFVYVCVCVCAYFTGMEGLSICETEATVAWEHGLRLHWITDSSVNLAVDCIVREQDKSQSLGFHVHDFMISVHSGGNIR